MSAEISEARTRAIELLGKASDADHAGDAATLAIAGAVLELAAAVWAVAEQLHLKRVGITDR